MIISVQHKCDACPNRNDSKPDELPDLWQRVTVIGAVLVLCGQCVAVSEFVFKDMLQHAKRALCAHIQPGDTVCVGPNWSPATKRARERREFEVYALNEHLKAFNESLEDARAHDSSEAAQFYRLRMDEIRARLDQLEREREHAREVEVETNAPALPSFLRDRIRS